MLKQTKLISSLVFVLIAAGCVAEGSSDLANEIDSDSGNGAVASGSPAAGSNDDKTATGGGGGDNDDGGGDCGDCGDCDDCDGPIGLPDQSVSLSIEVRGTGVFVGLDLLCGGLQVAGEFRAIVRATGQLQDGKVRITSLLDADVDLETADGCHLDGITIGAMTSIKVRAAIAANILNCDIACGVHARAVAVAECGSDDSCADCRAAVEADVRAECDASCAAETHKIVAELGLTLDVLARLNECGLGLRALVGLELDLEFDNILDGNDEPVCK